MLKIYNKLYKKIILDRFIKQEEEETNLVTEPELVKIRITEYYKKQFRKRITKLKKMTKE